MKIMFRFVAITLISVFILSGCSKFQNLSGSYDIETFLELMTPVFEATENTYEYATEEEKAELWTKSYQEGLRKIGFNGGESITLNGRLASFLNGSDENQATIVLTDKDESNDVFVHGNFNDIGWVPLLEKDSNLKISFDVIQDEDGNLDFNNCEIISPSKIDYEPDCNPYSDEAVIMGKVTNIFTFTLSEKEIEEARDEASFTNHFWWYSAMRWADKYIIIEDDIGHEIGVFVCERYNPKSISVGDKIGCYGDVRDIDIEDYPSKFMDATLLGGYYIFSD